MEKYILLIRLPAFGIDLANKTALNFRQRRAGGGGGGGNFHISAPAELAGSESTGFLYLDVNCTRMSLY